MTGVSQQCCVDATELHEIILFWIKFDQRNVYTRSGVISAIQGNRRHNLVMQLDLFLDTGGVIRCRGRLDHAELNPDAVHPILLARNSTVTRLLVQYTHKRLLHAGVNHTLNELRQTYWLPKGRAVVRQILSTCVLCKKQKGHPFALPPMPSLPRKRVSRSKPFQYTGVDYFGPIKVSYPHNSEPQKMWVCLFTCLAVRAVHLEWISDCTSQTFIDCLSRFIARRGCPEEIISDNAPQFKLAKNLFDKTWQSILSDDCIQSYIAQKGSTWRFITELSPWKGGFYERLVGMVKTAFLSVVGRKFLTWNQFATLIAEVEAVVNSRPMMYVGQDFETGVSLRPVDFLADQPVGTPSIEPSYRSDGGEGEKLLVRYWKAKQRKLDILWQKWRHIYLTNLRERHQISHRNSRSADKDSPVIDEVVLVKSEDAPRGLWKLGRITQTIRSSDGNIRTVELLLPNRQLIRRPVSHLYRLEIPSTNNPCYDTVENSDVNDFDGFTEAEVQDTENRYNQVKSGDERSLSMVICAAQDIIKREINK